MSLDKFEFEESHTKANGNFLFDGNLKGSVHYYDVIEGICLRNTDYFFFKQFIIFTEFPSLAADL